MNTHSTRRTIHCFPIFYHFFEHILRDCILWIPFEIIFDHVLILCTIQPIVNDPTCQTIDQIANRAFVLIHIILVNAPSRAVRCTTMKWVFNLILRHPQRFGQMLVVLIFREQRFNFAILQRALASVFRVDVRTPYFSVLAVDNRISNAFFAKCVQTIAQHNTFGRLIFNKTHGTFECFCIDSDVIQIV